jgi:hypothetical protein
MLGEGECVGVRELEATTAPTECDAVGVMDSVGVSEGVGVCEGLT